MNELVAYLSNGSHVVEFSGRPEKSAKALKESLERGLVLVRFTETKGGTELGVPVDRQLTDVTGADFEAGTGVAKVVGTLTLDFTRVRCSADIDLSLLSGKGRLEVLTADGPTLQDD